MSRPQTYEQCQLAKLEEYLSLITDTYEGRLQALEVAASKKSGINIENYRKDNAIPPIQFQDGQIEHLVQLIGQTNIPFAMVISSLAREPLSVEEQKRNGVFYTDFRLATFLAGDCVASLYENSTVADFAAGTGILLVGVAEEYKKKYPNSFTRWISNNLYAFDLSQKALRGAVAAFMSMTSDVIAIKQMYANWKICDSLLDIDVDVLKVDIVVGNPPWGKIKLSRHSFITQNGEQRVYGTDYQKFDSKDYDEQKNLLQEYSKEIKQKYTLLGKAEPDMYMAFIQRAIKSIGEAGHFSFLVPAGLIRSQGTQVIREYLLENGNHVEFVLLDNQANFFSIDSRFKFVMVSFDKVQRKPQRKPKALDNIFFSIGEVLEKFVFKGERVIFDVKEMRRFRTDLTIPEVKTEAEKNLFFKICENGRAWGTTDDIWRVDISREVDMTNDRHKFQSKYDSGSIPVIEGRMVQQHRFGTKSYISGSGRSAKWVPSSTGCVPQFYISTAQLQSNQLERIQRQRAGYCDIAGQTNERAMMSSLIPANVICGNKVPTVVFPNDDSGDMIYLWVGITNSFVFDWMIRRIILVTINYFLLLSVPMPNISLDSEIAQNIIEKTKRLSEMNSDFYTGNEMPELRAEIDLLVACSYGLTKEDMELIMKDFPILDRKQPCFLSECKSTVTRDLLLAKFEKFFCLQSTFYSKRVEKEKGICAKAYIPTEMTTLSTIGGA
ncbi:Eco57I restriction-modification methylase domain-containing protein [Lacrimispora celerecrescens]|uniref:Eco57I restriction-modification methylase domain-containing protein n=1 Tax=Lacrimispora celerecrescens TaxID=29354 RepID=UPI0016450976|nr:class I SAM-dependent methyltransferase [Lacrimispora celerecrescens]